MIHVWHGKDQKALYGKLDAQIYSKTLNPTTKISTDKSKSDLTEVIFSQNLFGEKPTIICEDFIKDKKVDPKFLQKIPPQIQIIFWESTQLTKDQINKFTKVANVEEFKELPVLYQFLDSLQPQSKTMYRHLNQIKLEDNQSLIWQIANRFFYLILAKKEVPSKSAEVISRSYLHSNLYDWQWQKIKNQSQKFDFKTLVSTFKSTLKMDNLIKSGCTDLPQKTLISMLLMKYL